MKSRITVAVLFVLVLVAVVLAGCGDASRQDTETKGKPITGAKSVTRSVAWIEAHRGTHEAIPTKAAEESDAEAARESLGNRNVREKPEPGEEGGPPKSAGHAVPLQRSGRSAIGPRSSLEEGASFEGADSGDSGFIPPDSMGSVGPTQIVVSVNGLIRVYDKSGNVVALNGVSDADFWDPVLSSGAEPTDPGVEYDRLEQRWILSAIDVTDDVDTNNRLMIAVSDGPEITDESDFTFYFFNESDPLPGPARFADYPQMAVDANAVYIGVNLFNAAGNFT